MPNLASSIVTNAIDVTCVDVAIIGAGPAGLSAAIQAKKRQLSHVVLEASPGVADTIHSFADGKWVMDEPIKLPQRSGLSFSADTKEGLIQSWQDQAKQYQVDIRFNERVAAITKPDRADDLNESQFVIQSTSGNEYYVKKIVLAFGVQGKPVTLPSSVDPMRIADYLIPQDTSWNKERILIVGAGDSAVEEALLLSKTNRVVLLNRRNHFERCKAGNQAAIKKAILEKKIQCISNGELISLSKSDLGSTVVRFKDATSKKRVEVDQVLVRIGTQSPMAVFRSLGLDLVEEFAGRLRLNEYGETSEQGVYAIGALSGQSLIKQGMNQGMICIEHLSGYPVMPTELMLLQEKLTKNDIKNSAREVMTWVHATGLFKHLSESAVRETLMNAEVLVFENPETLINNGQYNEELFLVLAGSLDIHTQNDDNFVIDRGESFGEITLLSKQASKFSVVARKGSVILKFPQSAIFKLLKANQAFKIALLKLYLKRSLKWLMRSAIPSHLLDLFLKQSELVELSKGQKIVANGELIYLLVSGSVSVAQGDDYLFKQGGGQIGFKEALEHKPLPAFEVNQDSTVAWALPVSLIAGFHNLNPELVSQRINADLELVSHPVPHQIGTVDPAKFDFFANEDLGNAGNVLVIDREKCVGWDACENACASTHDGVSRLDRKAGVLVDNLLVASACRHCKTPSCLTDCPADAIERKPTGEVVINDQCIGCGNCAESCVYNVISMTTEPEAHWLNKLIPSRGSKADKPSKAVKCDLCVNQKNGPACVQACPTGAAQRINPAKLIHAVSL